MHSISPNLNLMIKSCEKVSKILIRDFGEVEKLQVSIKGPKNFEKLLLHKPDFLAISGGIWDKKPTKAIKEFL